MRIFIKVISICVVIAASNLLFADQQFVDQQWSTSGLKMPESVEYDETNNRFYVSNINGGVMEQDNNGSIGLLNGKGTLENIDWVTGLHSPKGLALHKNKLYVADVKELVVINVDTAKVIARYEAKDSNVLNGITINKEGKVFVSDWMGNRIYTLADGELKIWLESTELNSPNGLWIDDQFLYVASWGSYPKADFTTEKSGNLKKISLKDKNIKTVEHGSRWINMDGISSYEGNKWLISDFLKGEILLMDNKGHIEKSIKSKVGAADFFYIKEKNLLVVPLFMDNKVVAYKLD